MFGPLGLLRTGALPQEPTPALPGTEEKIRIMIERAARREQLFHPLDGLPAQALNAAAPALSPEPEIDLPPVPEAALFALEAMVEDFEDALDPVDTVC